MLVVLLALSSCGKEHGPAGGGGGSDTPKEWMISGTVKGDDGALLEGVVVSDGQYCVKTDEQGRYYLPSTLSGGEHSYVMVSTPSSYAAPVQEGHACFWKWLKDCTKDSNGKYVADFTLKKIANQNRYKVLVFGDPQPRKRAASLDQFAYSSLDMCNDMYIDMKEYVAANKNCPVYGIGLGDIVHQDLTLLDQYREGMSTTGLTTYNVIGNHDQEHKLDMSDEEASKAYEAIMGPANYSFNLGEVHYLMLDNMMSQDGKYSDDCATGLTDEIWEWVKADLAHVSLDTPLMVCAHSPMMRLHNGKERSGSHLKDLRYLLSKYKKAYVWAGHTHATFNYVDTANPVIETHTVSRVTGCLYTNEYLGANGTPRGYVVVDYNNGEVSWKFKPLYYQKGTFRGYQMGDDRPDYKWRDWNYDANGRAVMKSTGKPLDETYQMQVFPPKTYGAADMNIYVNIFLWDELWSTPRLTVDGVPFVMKRVTEKDFCYSYSDWDITNFYHTKGNWSWVNENFVPNKNNNSSMFRAFVDCEHGSGTVSVKDRFGNTHTSVITW
jgi:hypothetical protein